MEDAEIIEILSEGYTELNGDAAAEVTPCRDRVLTGDTSGFPALPGV